MELGRTVMEPRVRIWDDGQDEAGLPSTIDYEGVRKQRVDLVTDGVATGLVHDTATARRAGTRSTGHGLPAPNTWGPVAWNLFMAGGEEERDALVSRLDRGIWITRFHYVNVVHAQARDPDRDDEGRDLPGRGRAGRAPHPQPPVHAIGPGGVQSRLAG